MRGERRRVVHVFVVLLLIVGILVQVIIRGGQPSYQGCRLDRRIFLRLFFGVQSAEPFEAGYVILIHAADMCCVFSASASFLSICARSAPAIVNSDTTSWQLTRSTVLFSVILLIACKLCMFQLN